MYKLWIGIAYMKTFKERGLDFLSNMYLCDCEYNGITFKSSEHLYQWLKVDTDEYRIKILNIESPYMVKRIVRDKDCKLKRVKNIDDFLINNMRIALYSKFKTNKDLYNKLRTVEDYDLIEWNYWNDKFWGKSIRTGTGDNNLGKLLKELKYDANMIFNA